MRDQPAPGPWGGHTTLLLVALHAAALVAGAAWSCMDAAINDGIEPYTGLSPDLGTFVWWAWLSGIALVGGLVALPLQVVCLTQGWRVALALVTLVVGTAQGLWAAVPPTLELFDIGTLSIDILLWLTVPVAVLTMAGQTVLLGRATRSAERRVRGRG